MASKKAKTPKTWEVNCFDQVYTIVQVSPRSCIVKKNGLIVEDDKITSGVFMYAFLDLAVPQEKWVAWIELPYDRGFPYKLHLKGETAVISAAVAEYLHQVHNFPMGNTRNVAATVTLPKDVGGHLMSSKARRLLGL